MKKWKIRYLFRKYASQNFWLVIYCTICFRFFNNTNFNDSASTDFFKVKLFSSKKFYILLVIPKRVQFYSLMGNYGQLHWEQYEVYSSYFKLHTPMTYVTINIEIEAQYSSFGATKNNLRLIIVFQIAGKHCSWGRRDLI